MTFQDYVIEETNEQELFEDLEFDDNSVSYSIDLDYTTQE